MSNGFSNGNLDRLDDLMILQATYGLSESEFQELDQLSSASDNSKKLEQYELSAAAFDLALQGNDETIPTSVHDQVLLKAGKFFEQRETQSGDYIRPQSDEMHVSLPENRRSVESRSTRRELLAVLVAAASLLLLLTGWNPFGNSPTAEPDAVAMMNQLIETNPSDLVDWKWLPNQSPSASGKVIWSDSKQEGYMVLAGLDVNDPTVSQYQLWIFDTDPDQEVPTDGGVFDFDMAQQNAEGQVVIPIRPHVPVDKAVQFAVTVERPGGVSKSERENIPVLANKSTNDD